VVEIHRAVARLHGLAAELLAHAEAIDLAAHATDESCIVYRSYCPKRES
jgi:hypothetical protein